MKDKNKNIITYEDLIKTHNSKTVNYNNVYYIGDLNIIGGIETFLYELARKYQDIDIVFLYNNVPEIQLNRLRKYAYVKKYNGELIKCKRAFFNNDQSIIENIEAEEYIRIVHGDYKGLHWMPTNHSKITKYYGVSQVACDSFTELTGLPCELCYNPITLDEPKRVLNLLSATRLTAEKGKDRIIKLANALDAAHIPYVWLIFTDDTQVIDNPNIIYKKPTLNIRPYIAKADYVVQLSNTEAYSYTILESLSLKTPVIVTPVPSFYEQGINEQNSIVIDFDMKHIPVDKIYNSHLSFDYEPKEDKWQTLLYHSPNNRDDILQGIYLVEATNEYEKLNIEDKDLQHTPKPGEQWHVNFYRLLELLKDNPYNRPFVVCKGKISTEENNE